MVLSQVHDDWNKHWERLFLVRFQDVQEIVIFEEAHCPVSNLQMDTADAFNDSLEQFGYQMVDLVNFTDFEYFLQLSQEEGLFDTVCKWPIFEESLQ